MTYTVSGGTLNPTHSLTRLRHCRIGLDISDGASGVISVGLNHWGGVSVYVTYCSCSSNAASKVRFRLHEKN